MFTKFFYFPVVISICSLACKPSNHHSNVNLAKSRQASYDEKATGLKELIGWTIGLNSILDIPIKTFDVTINTESNGLELIQILDAKDEMVPTFHKFVATLGNNLPFYGSDPETRSVIKTFSVGLMKDFSFEQRVEYLVKGLNLNWNYEDPYRINIAHSTLLSQLFSMRVPLFSDEEFQQQSEIFFKKVKENISASGRLAFYDGEKHGFHKVNDPQLFKSLAVISYTVLLNAKTNLKSMIQMNGNQPFVDTNTNDPLTRVEAFDLLSGMISILLHRHHYYFKKNKNLHTMVQYAMKKRLNMDTYQIPPVSIKKHEDSSIDVVCNLSDTEHFDPMIYASLWNSSSLFRSEFNDISMECGGQKFVFSRRTSQSNSLWPPKPFSEVVKSDKVFKMKLYLTIANEVSRSFIEAFKIVAGMNDIKFKSSSENTARSDYALNFVESDMIVYAGHDIPGYNLHIGSETNKSYLFEGEHKGKKFELELIIPYSGKPVTLSKDTLEGYYVSRMKLRSNQDPLFIFVTSCNSDSHVNLWSAIYHQAYKKSGYSDARKDFPYVLASKRSFPTNSTLETLGHAFYPLDAMKYALEGVEIDKIYEYFQNRNYTDIFKEASVRTGKIQSRVFESIFKIRAYSQTVFSALKAVRDGRRDDAVDIAMDDLYEMLDKGMFEPVYNLSVDHRNSSLSAGEYEFVLTQSSNQDVLQVIGI